MDSYRESRLPGPTAYNTALLLIRVAGSLPFLYHGSAILFGAFGGPGPQKFAAFMHAPAIIGYLVGLAQVAGGLAILLGLFTRIGAACIFVVMAGAVLLVHLPHGYDVSKGGMEFALTELFIAIAIIILGPGSYALGAGLPHPFHKL
jgi:putative oxidoreductase